MLAVISSKPYRVAPHGAKHRIEQCCLLIGRLRWTAISPCENNDPVPVRRKYQSAFRIGTVWFSATFANHLNDPRGQLPSTDQLLCDILHVAPYDAQSLRLSGRGQRATR